jgi:hypothetical protein
MINYRHLTFIFIVDPTSVDWGNEKEEPPVVEAAIPASTSSTSNTVQTYKCTALYSYTVSIRH